MLAAGLPKRVTVYEVGPRDGLQNVQSSIATDVKIEFINRLSDAGLPVIEVTSFVRSGAIPQLADAEEVIRRITRKPGVRYTALVPNMRGMERALAAEVDGIALFTAASETFSEKNTNASIQETFDRFVPVAAAARGAGMWIRGYVSTAFGCPYEGEVPVRRVVDVAARLIELGAAEVAISDTIGIANPRQVETVVRAVAERVPIDAIGLHFHDTYGTALANVLAGLLSGVSTYDGSAGGLGGCPYAPGASGNLATEDLLHMLHSQGVDTGVILDGVVDASRFLAESAGQSLESRYIRAVTG